MEKHGCDVGNPGLHCSLDLINSSSKKTMNWFAGIVAHHPYVILMAVAVLAGTCLIIPLTTKKLPDFSDPQMGFESRGTILAQRLTAWRNLLDAVGPSGPLTIDPRKNPAHKVHQYNTSQNAISKRYKTEEKHTILAHKMTTRDNQQPKVMSPVGNEVFRESKNNTNADTLRRLMEFEASGVDHLDHHHGHEHLSSDGFFCASPSADYSRVVFSATDGGDLFTVNSILSMCHVDAQLMASKQFHSICQYISDGKCCHSWSLGNYIALLHNRTSCFGVIVYFGRLLFGKMMPSAALGLRLVRWSCITRPAVEKLLSEGALDAGMA